MREIPLRTRDGVTRLVALVDDEDYERVNRHSWSLDSSGYAKTKIPPTGVDRRYQSMHRLVMGMMPGDRREVDHKDNKAKLDNRKANLRVVTQAANAQNRTANKIAPHRAAKRVSEFRGVCWHDAAQAWRAYVRHDGVLHYLGTFTNELEAALVAQGKRAEIMPFALPDPAIARALENSTEGAETDGS